MKRIKITSKEVAFLTGSGVRNGCKIINKIKMRLNKNKDQFLTRWEFADYMSISKEEIDYGLSLKNRDNTNLKNRNK